MIQLALHFKHDVYPLYLYPPFNMCILFLVYRLFICFMNKNNSAIQILFFSSAFLI